MKIRKMMGSVLFAAAITPVLLGSSLVLADSSHGKSMDHGKSMNHSQMMSEMRDVQATGRVNKIMADKHMINISHKPIAELKWPKMRMNFKMMDHVDVKEIRLGQLIGFSLQVDNEQNYIIKNITPK